MSLLDILPISIIKEIYEYDLTYKEKLNESLSFIEHACPTCICDGGKKERYRHHYDIGTFEFPFWNWEWRRRNACPKHNPGDFDKDGNQIEYNFIDNYMHSRIITLGNIYIPDEIFNDALNTYYNYENSTRRIWYRYRNNGTINYNIIMLSLWMFCTRFQDIYPSPIKTYSRKKLTGSRFMDMRHDQRPIAA